MTHKKATRIYLAWAAWLLLASLLAAQFINDWAQRTRPEGRIVGKG